MKISWRSSGRGNWEISRRDLRSPGLMTMVANERGLLGVASGDFADVNSRSVMLCRCVAVIVSNFLSLGRTDSA